MARPYNADMSLGEGLRVRMQQLGITTATDLAARLQVHQSTAARWLAGAIGVPRAGQLRSLAQFLDVPEETVLVMAHRGRSMTETEVALRRDETISDEDRGRLLDQYREAQDAQSARRRPSAPYVEGR